MSGLAISTELWQQVLRHCRDAMPDEACGLISGTNGEAARVYELKNVEPSPVSYTTDPNEQLKALKDVADEGHKLLAIYHSHPASPPLPSAIDIRRAFFPGTEEPNYPGVLYVIVSFMNETPEARAYLIEPGGTVEADLRIG